MEKNKLTNNKNLENEIIIHTIPKKFQVSSIKRGGSKFSGAFFILIIAVGLSVGFYYFYNYLIDLQIKSNNDAMVGSIIKSKELKEIPSRQKPVKKNIQTEKEAFLEIKKKIDNTDTYENFVQIFLMHASKERIKDFNYYIASSEDNLIKNNKSIILEHFKNPLLKSANIGEIKIEQDVATTTAILKVNTKNKENNGTIEMLFEENAWKIDSEKWSFLDNKNIWLLNIANIEKQSTSTIATSTISTSTVSQATSTIATSTVSQATSTVATSSLPKSNIIDNDKDGLSVQEETIFKSSDNNPDSDNDGYSDMAEIMNLYDPVSGNQLINNANISEYKNSNLKYSILHPTGWNISTIDNTGSSLFFQSSDNKHFIQIISQVNTNSQLIYDWYKKEIVNEELEDSRFISQKGWDGIQSQDGLIIYLTPKDKKNIFIISYSVNMPEEIVYKNIFNMMVKSFSISE